MSSRTVTVALDDATYEWLEEVARTSEMSVAEAIVHVVKGEQARAAMEGVAAWARGDESAPTMEEIDRARARMLGDDEA